MAKKSKKLLIIFSVLFALLLISFFIRPDKTKNDRKVNSGDLIIAVYPASSLNETYLFDIFPNGNIIASLGTRKNINISYDDLKANTPEKYSQYIKTEYLIRLYKTINEIIENKCYLNYRESYDWWDITVLYSDKIYKMNLDRNEKYVKELIEILSEISPIIIDIHAWS